MKLIRDTLLLLQTLMNKPETGAMIPGLREREAVTLAITTQDQLRRAIDACDPPTVSEAWRDEGVPAWFQLGTEIEADGTQIHFCNVMASNMAVAQAISKESREHAMQEAIKQMANRFCRISANLWRPMAEPTSTVPPAKPLD